MSDIAIVMSVTEGGLAAVVQGTGYQIIRGTERSFSSLATYADVPSTDFGHIDTGSPGWMALAELA